MTPSPEPSPARRLAASAALLGSAAGFAGHAVSARHVVDPALLSLAAVIALAGLGLGRRSVVTQVLSRGVGIFAVALATLAAFADRSLFLGGIALSASAALVLARPLLHTRDAHEAFAPLRFRKALLAGATGTVAFSVIAGLGGLVGLSRHAAGAGLGLVAIAAALVASAIGVARMRAWGVLLAALTSIVCISAALLVPAWSAILAALALPGALVIMPIVLARLGLGEPLAEARVAPTTTRTARIAVDPDPTAAETEATAVAEELEHRRTATMLEGR
jgi:hypothetical protein